MQGAKGMVYIVTDVPIGGDGVPHPQYLGPVYMEASFPSS